MECALLITLDRMGQRYGMLPNEVMIRASTFDLVVMDVAMTMEQHARDSQEKGYVPPVSTDELLKIKERAQ